MNPGHQENLHFFKGFYSQPKYIREYTTDFGGNIFGYISQITNKILKEEREVDKVFEVEEIITSIKKNYSFCWYQFYKFLFVFTNRWRKSVGDLETFCVGMVVMLNFVERESFRVKDLNIKQFQNSLPNIKDRGVNAMSISEITGIPRATVVRKLKHLIDNGFLSIDEKKLLEVNISGKALQISKDQQDKNILRLI